MIDPFLKLLRELGLTPKELADFKVHQRNYKQVEIDILKLNEKVLKTRTGTKSFSWKQLYEHVENNIPQNKTINDLTHDEIRNVINSEINNIYNEQSQQTDDYKDYGITSELKSLILTTKQHYEVYSKQSHSNEEVLNHVKQLIIDGLDISTIVDTLDKFNDLWIRYFDSETSSFPLRIENRYFIEIGSAGHILGYE